MFAILPPGAADAIREHVAFYDWDASTREVRWMCAFDTTESDVDHFAGAIVRQVLSGRLGASVQAGRRGHRRDTARPYRHRHR